CSREGIATTRCSRRIETTEYTENTEKDRRHAFCLFPCFPCIPWLKTYFTSSFRSLNRTSIGPPLWICRPKIPFRETFSSLRSTHNCPLIQVLIFGPTASITYSFHSSTLTCFSPLLSQMSPRALSS